MIPIRDANPTSRFPVLTIGLIIANALVFFLWQPSFGTEGEQFRFYLCNAEIPYEVTNQGNLAGGGADARAAIVEDFGSGTGGLVQGLARSLCPDKSWLLSVFVAMFLHGGLLHIGGNMLFLWIFGNNVEDRLGYLAYPLFYVMGGIAAAALQIAFDPDSTIPNLGASGAIGAILGAYAVLFPGARVTTLVFFFFITAIQIPAVLVLGVWFVLQVFSGGSQIGDEVGGGVAYWAHVGGFVFGAVVAWAFYRRGGRDRRFEPSAFPRRPDID